MFYLRLLASVLIVLVFLNACMSPQTEKNENTPFMNISTDRMQEQQEEEQQRPLNVPNESSYEIEQFNEGQSSNVEENEPKVSEKLEEEQEKQDSLQQTIPEDLEPKDLEQRNSGTKEQETVMYSTALPFQHFSQRWNAITDAEGSGLYIKNLEKVSDESSEFFRAQLTELHEMRIFVVRDYVQRIDLVSKKKTKNDVFQMLSGWAQIINILHPNLEINDVDAFFNQIGVGPNGDLSNLNTSAITYNQLFYEVNQTDNGYHFCASYSKIT